MRLLANSEASGFAPDCSENSRRARQATRSTRISMMPATAASSSHSSTQLPMALATQKMPMASRTGNDSSSSTIQPKRMTWNLC